MKTYTIKPLRWRRKDENNGIHSRIVAEAKTAISLYLIFEVCSEAAPKTPSYYFGRGYVSGEPHASPYDPTFTGDSIEEIKTQIQKHHTEITTSLLTEVK